MKITLTKIGTTTGGRVAFQVANDERPGGWSRNASNGIEVFILNCPTWFAEGRVLYLQGQYRLEDDKVLTATREDYAAIEAAVAEVNAAEEG